MTLHRCGKIEVSMSAQARGSTEWAPSHPPPHQAHYKTVPRSPSSLSRLVLSTVVLVDWTVEAEGWPLARPSPPLLSCTSPSPRCRSPLVPTLRLPCGPQLVLGGAAPASYVT